MLRIDRKTGQLSRLNPLSLSEADIKERADLQQLIYRCADHFFQAECREDLFVLNQEVMPSGLVGDRIDLLAVDSEGKTVIIELKRGSDKLQLLQALSYAAMISDLPWQQIRDRVDPARAAQLEKFLEANELDDESGERGALNEFQRVLLIAESYDYEILRTAQWLTDKAGIDIRCYEVALARDPDNQLEYLSAVQLFPAKPLAERARLTGSRRILAANEPRTIEKRVSQCSNQAVKAYFESLLGQVLPPRTNRRGSAFVFPPQGKMRYHLSPRDDYARVIQRGRFLDDEAQWKPLSTQPKKLRKGRRLVFQLRTPSDIELFRCFAENDLLAVKWLESAELEADDADDKDEE